jgi:hypothetical protein
MVFAPFDLDSGVAVVLLAEFAGPAARVNAAAAVIDPTVPARMFLRLMSVLVDIAFVCAMSLSLPVV